MDDTEVSNWLATFDLEMKEWQRTYEERLAKAIDFYNGQFVHMQETFNKGNAQLVDQITHIQDSYEVRVDPIQERIAVALEKIVERFC